MLIQTLLAIKKQIVLAKAGNEPDHRFHTKKHMTSPLYFLHKDFWLGNTSHMPYKESLYDLQRYVIKHLNMYLMLKNYLQHVHFENKFLNISKWISNSNIDNKLFNTLWKNPQIFKAQIKQLIKFCTCHYMRNTIFKIILAYLFSKFQL